MYNKHGQMWLKSNISRLLLAESKEGCFIPAWMSISGDIYADGQTN